MLLDDWEGGISFSGRFLSNLRYADNTTLLSTSLNDMKELLFAKGDTRWETVRNKIIRKIAAKKKDFYHNRIQSLKSENPSAWYREIKFITSGQKSCPTIAPPPGVDPRKESAVAESINKHFVSITKDIPIMDRSSLPAFIPASDSCPTVHEWEVMVA